MKSPPISQDERFHFEIYSGATEEVSARNPSLVYVENHNADFDYDLAATDFKMAADALIKRQLENPHLSNWTAPVCHLIRQTVELELKGLVQVIAWLEENELPKNVAFTHNLEKLWNKGKAWLISNRYPITSDARFKNTERLVENLHAIDPLGDLFRFGTSKSEAFGRQKTSDRVGYNQLDFFQEFDEFCGFLSHWSGAVMRETIKREEGWETDPYFDVDSFPKISK